MLSGAGADVRWMRGGDFAADFSDEGSGGGAEAGGGQRSVSEQFADGPADGAGAGQRRGGKVSDIICGPGTAEHPAVSFADGETAPQSGGGGRGPLHFPMGTGFPAGISGNSGFHPAAAPQAVLMRLYGYGHPGGAGGHCAAAGAGKSLCMRHGLRPAEFIFPGIGAGPEGRDPFAAGGGIRREKRHCILRHPQGGGKRMRNAERAGDFRHAVSRGAFRPGTPGKSGGLCPGQRPGDGGHQRLRHGH